MSRLDQSRGFVRVRGVLGVLYIGLGAVIATQIIHRVGLCPEAISGIVLGLALIAMGILRIRAAWATRRTPLPPEIESA